MKTDHENGVTRLELKYCERCGGLWVRECGAGVVYCDHCQRSVAELPIPKKKPQRVMLPVQKKSLVDEFGGDDLEFEAAGGAA
jgi:ribosomal protein L37AE/L43A